MSNVLQILWPEKRVVGEKVINQWYADACANGDIVNKQFQGISDYDWYEQALALHDAGLITLQRQS